MEIKLSFLVVTMTMYRATNQESIPSLSVDDLDVASDDGACTEHQQPSPEPRHEYAQVLEQEENNATYTDNKIKYEVTEPSVEDGNFNNSYTIDFISSPQNLNGTSVTKGETSTNMEQLALSPAINPKYLSILHIKAGYGHEDQLLNALRPQGAPSAVQGTKPNLNVLNFLAENAFHSYINGVKKGVANGLNSLGSFNYQPYINRVVSVPGLVAAAPVHLFNKIHRKTAEAASRIHDALFGETIRH